MRAKIKELCRRFRRRYWYWKRRINGPHLLAPLSFLLALTEFPPGSGPFAVAFVAAVGRAGLLPAGVGALPGYLFAGRWEMVPVCAFVLGIRRLLYGKRVFQSVGLRVCIGLLACLVGGFLKTAFVSEGGMMFDVMEGVVSGSVGGLMTLFYSGFDGDEEADGGHGFREAAYAATGFTLVLFCSGISPTWLDLGVGAAAVFTLCAIRHKGTLAGGAAGLLAGLAVGLQGQETLFWAGTLGLAGLAGGFFSVLSPFWTAASFCVTTLTFCVALLPRELGHTLWALVVGCAAAMPVLFRLDQPREKEIPAAGNIPRELQYTRKRLDGLAEAFCDIACALETLRGRKGISEELAWTEKQFATTAQLLAGLECSDAQTGELCEDIAYALRRLGAEVETVDLKLSGGAELSVLLSGVEKMACTSRELAKTVSGILQTEMAEPEFELREDGFCRMTMCRQKQFAFACSMALQPKFGQEICGDHVCMFQNGQRQFICLSDGMGSGPSAALESGLVTMMLRKLLENGAPTESALLLVNTALLSKTGEESYATADVLVADSFKGAVHLYKCGSAPSYLYRQGKITALEADSLPLGILTSARPRRHSVELEDGDVLILMSDGVGEPCEDFWGHLKDWIRSPRPAEALLSTVVTAFGDVPDDLSAAVIQVYRCEEVQEADSFVGEESAAS